ncbi:MAG: DNA helicase RecQ [Gammaproteobacteria bacterium]
MTNSSKILNSIDQVLKSKFGYQEFRLLQREIIDHLVSGGDALVLMPTGGGKSLCYQIPAIVGVVISPLIALMQDQVHALRENGINSAYINSTLSAEEVIGVEDSLINGQLDLLYIAPERLMMPRMLTILSRIPISLFAIDESHCVSQWGHDFRPEYIQLSILHEKFPEVPRIALTATADEPTRNEIIHRLALLDAKKFISGFDRPNICYRVNENQGNARERLLDFILKEHEGESGIIYCISRKRVDDIAAWLESKGLIALPYHAGMSAENRNNNQDRFLREDSIIIVATIAFGMGIDKPDVRFVAHLNMPKSIEAYYQETGRAGRDGMAADAWMSYGLQDVITMRQMQSSSDADESYKRIERQKLDAMLGFSELNGCRRQALLRYFGDNLENPCGNCDNCLEPPVTWDATVAAQKALSCVHRTGQRFGVNYLVDVLLGKRNDRIVQFGHDKITTFGIGTELSQNEWRNVFRQLIANGLLVVDVAGYGGLQLTDNSRPVLRGEQKIELRKITKPVKSARRERKGVVYANENEKKLWDSLRECRSRLASEHGLPAYMIFHDATLMDIVDRRPENIEQFSRVSGVGDSKLAHYASAFLEVLKQHQEVLPTTNIDSVSETLGLLRKGKNVEEIAAIRELKPATIYSHLATLIEDEKIELQQGMSLSKQQLSHISLAFEQFGGDGKLKPVYDSLDGEFDYGILRCVKASLNI